MLSFVNPGLLGPLASFKKTIIGPVHRSRDREATDAEKQLGKVWLRLLLRNNVRLWMLRELRWSRVIALNTYQPSFKTDIVCHLQECADQFAERVAPFVLRWASQRFAVRERAV